MHFFEELIGSTSSVIWSIFLPVLIIMSIVISVLFFTKVQNKTTKKSKINPKDIIAPAAISMGAMIGTGAIIGVLGSMMGIATNGQMYFEAIAGWALIGAVILLPLCYIETLVCKTTKQSPKNYISKFLNPRMGAIYAYAFILLYVFGFGGFQVQGINSAITIIVENFFAISTTPMMRYVVLVVPLLLIVSAIVLAKKHEVFINSMALMIGVAVVMYIIMVIIFITKTTEYVPVYIGNIWQGMTNPITAGIGLPIGFTVAVQRLTQTSEPGLGALAMSTMDSDSEPRSAGLIALIPAITTVFIAIFVTSYITSYGSSVGLIDLMAGDSLVALRGYFDTCFEVAGYFGLFTITIFTVLSGITSLLGSFYFLNVLLDRTENQNIAIYITLIFIAGTLAVFGGAIIFEAVDLLLFVVTGINVAAIFKYVILNYKEYLI
ncbi:hypothetical protein RZE82_03105 [Mollicutes bacterium LVI A0039]|nr:hypothetical protein RZE82_03105 [Mollicutes bacterium LVI A0039]